jgi:hypothetical protein
VTTTRELLDSLVAAAPSLATWYREFRDQDVDHIWLHLAYELIDHARDGTIPELAAVAPHLERALEECDDQDQVSLGFIETFIHLAEERHLDTRALRQALGPIARQQWDSLYEYLHQGDWSLVHFETKQIRNCCPLPARLERWLVRPGARLESARAVARITAQGTTYDLCTTVPCYASRFAVQDGYDLSAGELLLYVLPDDHADIGQAVPYVELREAAS